MAQIGKITYGGIRKNVFAALDVSPESPAIEIGSYVTIQGVRNTYYAVVTDLTYGQPTDPQFAQTDLSERIPRRLAELITRRLIKPTAELMLGLSHPTHASGSLSPTVSLPPLHSPVLESSQVDINMIFGDGDLADHWVIGTTKQHDHKISLDLSRLVQRSTGIFGATGTGKSVLLRVILSGLIKRNTAAVLSFDLHSELAYDDRSREHLLPGFKTLFPQTVVSIGLGKNTCIRGNTPDHNIMINLRDIQPADVLALTEELNLNESAPTVISALRASFREDWLCAFLAMSRSTEADDSAHQPARSLSGWIKSAGVNKLSAEALHAKLMRIRRLPYVSDHPAQDSVQLIFTSLLAGRHVILSFGEQPTELDYALVSNLLARRLSEIWQAQAEQYRSSQGIEPRPLVIVVDEAHRFLSKNSPTTVFGTLAREMRKSYVSLIVVDQRPSEISETIMSQIGTRISGWLGDEQDIDAMLTGVSGREGLKRMLTSLKPVREMLLTGYAVPAPVVIRSRQVDEHFLREIQSDNP